MAYCLDEIKYEINGCEIVRYDYRYDYDPKKHMSLDNLQSQNLLNYRRSSGDGTSLQLFCTIKKFF